MSHPFDKSVNIFVSGLNDGIRNYHSFFDSNISIFEVGCYLLYKVDTLLFNKGFNEQLRQFMGGELLHQLIQLTNSDTPLKLPRGKSIHDIVNQRVLGYYKLMEKCHDFTVLHDNTLELIRHDLHKKGALVHNYVFAENVVASHGDGKSINLEFENVMIPKLALLEFDKSFTEKFIESISKGNLWNRHKTLLIRTILGLLLFSIILVLRSI